MAITTNPTSLKIALDTAIPGTITDMLTAIKIGSVVRALETYLRAKVPVASLYNLATLQAIVLPDDAKAFSVSRAYARAGTVTGELTAVAFGVTPTTGQFAVAPNGDIVVLAADAITSLDVTYRPDKYDMYELTLPVVPGTGVLTIPAAFTSKNVISVVEAEVVTGTTLGKKIILVPAAGAPATGNARLNVAKTQVQFAVADAVTSARIKFTVAPATDVDALLEAASIYI